MTEKFHEITVRSNFHVQKGQFCTIYRHYVRIPPDKIV